MTEEWSKAHGSSQIIGLGHLRVFHGDNFDKIQSDPLERVLSQFKLFTEYLGIWSSHKRVAKVLSLLWSVNLYLFFQFCSFGADFYPNYLKEL